MLTVVDGDFFNFRADILVHGCNCFVTQGSGIAGIFRKLYPGVYEADVFNGRKGDKSKLGTYSYWQGTHRNFRTAITIINAYTQYNFGKDTGPHVDYDAIRKVMETIKVEWPNHSICMPRIGCGLAGGDPTKVRRILHDVFDDHNMPVTVVKLAGEEF